MKQNSKLGFLNGFGGLASKFGMGLLKFLPIYIIGFVAWGDRILPSPLSDWSLNTRSSINQILVGKFPSGIMENEKYNNKKTDKIIEKMERR